MTEQVLGLANTQCQQGGCVARSVAGEQMMDRLAAAGRTKMASMHLGVGLEAENVDLI